MTLQDLKDQIKQKDFKIDKEFEKKLDDKNIGNYCNFITEQKLMNEGNIKGLFDKNKSTD